MDLLNLTHPVIEEQEEQMSEGQHEEQLRVYKLVNRRWKALPDRGDEDVYIRDPRLKEGRLGNLLTKTLVELEEILFRQDRILNNRYLISKLKDGGESLRKRREEVAETLEVVCQRERTVVNVERVPDVNAMEWRGCIVKPREMEVRDSDDDDSESEEKLDPLELMAYHSSSVKKPGGGGGRRDEEDPAEAIARELERLNLSDAAAATTTSPPTLPDNTTSTSTSTPAHDTITTPPTTLAHEPKLSSPPISIHGDTHSMAPSAPIHKPASVSHSAVVCETISTPPFTLAHENFTIAPATPVHESGVTTPCGSTHNTRANTTPSHTPAHTSITPSTRQDFGAKRIQMIEEKQRKNQNRREPFKPYRPSCHPQPLPELSHHARPVNDRPAICLSQVESVRLEQQYVLKEKKRMVTQQVSALRLGTRTVTPIHSYRDANMTRHLLDPDAEDEEWLEDAHTATPLPESED